MNEIADVTTENVVLGGLIFYPKEYSLMEQYIPEPKVFSQKKAQALWIKLSKMIKSGKNIDTAIVCASITTDDMNNGVTTGYIVDITTDACGLGMIEVYSQSIYEKYLLRKIVDETENIKKNVLCHGGDVYRLINQAHSLMGELIRVRPGEKFDIDKTMTETFNTMKESSKKMIKTGYKEIDALAGG